MYHKKKVLEIEQENASVLSIHYLTTYSSKLQILGVGLFFLIIIIFSAPGIILSQFLLPFVPLSSANLDFDECLSFVNEIRQFIGMDTPLRGADQLTVFPFNSHPR